VDGNSDTHWRIKGVGDFNGDGKADILWQHSSGSVVIWLMDGAAKSSVEVVAGNNDTHWVIKGVGDFGGDGKVDILWQHSTLGTVAIWMMNGTSIALVGVVATIDPIWKIMK
jgi:hypothetical protein